MNIVVERVNVTDFAESRAEWTSLLDKSCADPLFLSWEWQYNWWEIWGDALNLELVLLRATDGRGNLVGIAPMHRSRVKVKGLLAIKRLQFIGNHWRHTGTTRTEFLDFITVRGDEREISAALLEFLRSQFPRHELVICDLDKMSATYDYLITEGKNCGWVPRIAENERSIIVRNRSGFKAYIAEKPAVKR